MIDYDITKLKILPENHISLKDFEVAVKIQKQNEKLKGIIAFLIISTVALTLITNHYNEKKNTTTTNQ